MANLMYLNFCISNVYKKLFIFIIFLSVIINNLNAQSFGVQGGYTYYFLNQKIYGTNTTVSNNFNYKIGASVTKYFNNFFVEFGYLYATKNFKFKISDAPISEINTIEINSSYNMFPILIAPRLFVFKNNYYSLITGLTFIRNSSYSDKRIYGDGHIQEFNESIIGFKTGITGKLGFHYSKKLNNKFLFITSPHINYKLIRDYEQNYPGNEPSTDKFYIGLDLGFHYIFNSSNKYFNNVIK